MSNETHDQNKSVDTPDTAPSRMRILVLAVIAYLVVACFVWIFFYSVDVEFAEPVTPPVIGAVATGQLIQTVTPDLEAVTVAASSPSPSYAYWHGERALLTDEQIELRQLSATTELEFLKSQIEADPNLDVLFIDRSSLENISGDEGTLLQALYADGVMIVGLQTPHTALTDALQLETDLADVDPASIEGDDILASIHYINASGPQELVQIFDDFGGALNLVAALR